MGSGYVLLKRDGAPQPHCSLRTNRRREFYDVALAGKRTGADGEQNPGRLRAGRSWRNPSRNASRKSWLRRSLRACTPAWARLIGLGGNSRKTGFLSLNCTPGFLRRRQNRKPPTNRVDRLKRLSTF